MHTTANTTVTVAFATTICTISIYAICKAKSAERKTT